MAPALMSKSEFARHVGVSPAAITKAAATVLSGAMVDDRVDAGHPVAVEYYKKKTAPKPVKKKRPVGRPRKNGSAKNARKATPKKTSRKKPPAKKEPEKKARVPRGRESAEIAMKKAPPSIVKNGLDFLADDIREHADKSLRELVGLFGTDRRFKDWLSSIKAMEEIQEKRLKNEAARGSLISKELVYSGVLSPIESFHQKLLTDCVKTIASRTSAKVKAGAELPEIEKVVRDQIEKYMKPMKRKMVARLKNV